MERRFGKNRQNHKILTLIKDKEKIRVTAPMFEQVYKNDGWTVVEGETQNAHPNPTGKSKAPPANPANG